MANTKIRKGCLSRSSAEAWERIKNGYYVASEVVENYPNFAKYEKLTCGNLSSYIFELTLKGMSDDSIVVGLGVRWNYLFQLGFFDWFQIISEFRAYQKGLIENV